jgi:anti-anti-sigma factor
MPGATGAGIQRKAPRSSLGRAQRAGPGRPSLPGSPGKPMLNVGLSIRDADGRAVVALCGEFNLADAPGVASHLITAVAACGPSVIVDLAGLQSIGYSGLAVLLRIRKRTRRSGGDLALAAPQPTVRRVLEASGLIDVFSVYRSVDQAASGARHVQPPAPALSAPPPVQVSMVFRPAHRRPVYRMPCHSPARPLYRSGTCRSRHTPRNTCGKRRLPGGRTAA